MKRTFARGFPDLIRKIALAAACVCSAEALAQTNPPSGPEQAVSAPEAIRALSIKLYRDIATREAKARDLPSEIADAVMRIESNYNPKARGRDGEYGIMQVMPPTARMLGHKGSDDELADPETNIKLGVRYLAEAYALAKGDLCTTLMKYRAGHKETRFSTLSVQYCVAARTHLASRGFALKGEVPEATFGFRTDVTRMGSFIGTKQAAMRLRSGKKLKSRVNWGNYESKMKALTARGNFRL